VCEQNDRIDGGDKEAPEHNRLSPPRHNRPRDKPVAHAGPRTRGANDRDVPRPRIRVHGVSIHALQPVQLLGAERRQADCRWDQSVYVPSTLLGATLETRSARRTIAAIIASTGVERAELCAREEHRAPRHQAGERVNVARRRNQNLRLRRVPFVLRGSAFGTEHRYGHCLVHGSRDADGIERLRHRGGHLVGRYVRKSRAI